MRVISVKIWPVSTNSIDFGIHATNYWSDLYKDIKLVSRQVKAVLYFVASHEQLCLNVNLTMCISCAAFNSNIQQTSSRGPVSNKDYFGMEWIDFK